MTPLPPPLAPPPAASWLRRRVLDPLLNLLKQGLAPGQLALTVALGVVVGIVPLLGTTTMLAALVAWRLRLNIAALQLVTHLLTPLQLLLFVPLLRQGARLLGNAQEQNLSLAQMRHLFAEDWRAALHLLWRAELGAVVLWLLASVPLVAVMYFVLRSLFRRLAANRGVGTA